MFCRTSFSTKLFGKNLTKHYVNQLYSYWYFFLGCMEENVIWFLTKFNPMRTMLQSLNMRDLSMLRDAIEERYSSHVASVRHDYGLCR